MTLPLVLLNRRRIGGFSPRAIIAGSTALLWLDPSDLITLFQDAAGTTPVTAPGQPVGLALDKSQGLVLGPELVDTANSAVAWIAYGTNTVAQDGDAVQVTFASDAAGAYLFLTQAGGLSSNLVPGKTYQLQVQLRINSGSANFAIYQTSLGNYIDPTSITGPNYVTRVYNFQYVSGSPYIQFANLGAGEVVWIRNISVRELPGFHATQSTAANRPTYGVVPSRGRVNILNATATLATQTRPVTAAQHTLSFRGTGTITLSGASTAGPLVGTGANDIVSLTFTPTAGNLTLTVSGTVNDAQLELGAARGTYQLVSDAAGFNITDPVGFPSYPLHYLFFGGDLDPRWLQTSTITPNADKVQVFAGVRKLSDAAVGIIYESSVNAGLNAGTIQLYNATDLTIQGRARGSNDVSLTTSALSAAPLSFVATLQGDIAGDTSSIRVNGVSRASSTADQGTGNYLAYPLFIGRRGGTSLAFNGQLFSLIVRFSTSNLDASLIAQTERWLAQKTGVTL